MDLTPAQQESIQRLLEDELRAALDGLDTAASGELVADRRRALDHLLDTRAHDVEDPLHQHGEGGGVAELD